VTPGARRHLVPQALQLGGGFGIAVAEQVDHLAEQPDLPVAGGLGAIEDRADEGAEHIAVGLPVDHQAGQGRLGVEDDQLIADARIGHVHHSAQLQLEGADVARGGDDRGGFAGQQPGADELGHRTSEERLVGIELHDVITRLRPAEQWLPGLRRGHVYLTGATTTSVG
jgi:hypothetical protein